MVSADQKSFCPDFFIVGAPKCGTTAMFNYLLTHPDIFMPDEKEPHYFAPELSDMFVKNRSSDSYEAMFAAAPSSAMSGEASPLYLYSYKALENILSVNPDAKFIVMLRNPVDMAISWHLQMIKSAYDDVAVFKEAWDLQDLRQQGYNVPKTCADPDMLQYRSVCALGDQVERLCNLVPPDQLMVILLDDLKKDPLGTYKDTLGFLGLSHDSRIDFPVINPTTGHMSPLLEKRLSKIKHSRKGVWGGLFYFFDRMNIYRIRPVFRPGYRPPPPPKPTFSVYRELGDVFAPQIGKLEKILGRNLKAWSYEGA